MKHNFRVSAADHSTNGTVVAVLDLHAFAIYAMTKLSNGVGTSGYRGQAIRFLRTHSPLGLYEAKQVVDYIADNGAITDDGKLSLVRRGTVAYLGTE